ncbi:centrocortin family member [Holotrichia oblita]|uniref:Centrocortin family member n=1 Tax=Holotrichia oblita TaxID=644536 RepID=A0ACB9T339_HOLOL|nr:centrocortin family member [Holotrichia oblita]
MQLITFLKCVHLQLAAELGKTLLERNKELENSLKQQQNIIEDQTQEIEYLTKQTVALREVNDSRLRIYEQLEVNIQDLERANHRLAVDNSADKKHIKSLTANIEALELKCEHLQSSIDDLTLQLEVARRKSQRLSTPVKDTFAGHTRLKRGDKLSHQLDDLGTRPLSPDSSCTHKKYDGCVSTTRPDRCQQTQTTPKKEEPDSTEPDSKEIEQIAYLMSQLREAHTQCAKDQRRITELQEQLETMQEQSKVLERQLSQYHIKEEEMKSVQDEFSSLEEVRQGQLCSRCLRTVNGDDMSLSACDDDDSSMFEALNERSQHRSSFSMDVQVRNEIVRRLHENINPTVKQGNNLYKDLVQKYEALLKYRNPTRNQKQVNNCLSLHEELQMSTDFTNLMNTKDTDEDSGHGDSLKPIKVKQRKIKAFSRTPTDFSEAETSSSGFSGTRHPTKLTQTDGRPGSFLCTIADGKDCISIYDDAASPIETATTKEENEDLPLLDDNTRENAPTVPPVTPSNDAFPDFPDNATDDTQSILLQRCPNHPQVRWISQ